MKIKRAFYYRVLMSIYRNRIKLGLTGKQRSQLESLIMKIDPKSDEKIYAERLDYYYFHNYHSYQDILETVKSLGYKVLRNGAGKHQVKKNSNFINEIFGGAFKGVL